LESFLAADGLGVAELRAAADVAVVLPAPGLDADVDLGLAV
jgi:hypothetical protein